MKLDLAELRIKLDQMTERIVSGLKDRSRYKLNPSVYVPGLVDIKGAPSIPLFEFSLRGLESYYATLGRYEFPDQYPLTKINLPQPNVKRTVPLSPIAKVDIDLRGDILQFYINSLKRLCVEGEDPETWGETAYCDAYNVELLNERINLGRFVAESKVNEDPSVMDILYDKKILIAKLKSLKRELDVIERAKNIASRYELSSDVVEIYFKWIIEKTLDVEVEYLQKRPKGFGGI